MVLFETHEQNKASKWQTKDMPVVKMRCKPGLTLEEVRQSLVNKLKLDSSTEFAFFDQRQQRVITRHTGATKCEMIDQSKVWTCVYEIKRKTPDDVVAELNFYYEKAKGKKTVTDSVDRAIPRVESFDPSTTILQAKRQLLQHY